MPMRDDFDNEILDIIPERFDADADSSNARKSARVRMLVTIGLGLLALMAMGIAIRHFLFGESPRANQISVPVIRAEDKPIKVKPQDKGGMEVPNQDKLIYDQMAAKAPSQQPERLLPPPEQPQAPPSSLAPALTPPGAAPAAKPVPSADQASAQSALPPPLPPPTAAPAPVGAASITAPSAPLMPKSAPSPVAPTTRPVKQAVKPDAKPVKPAAAQPSPAPAPVAAAPAPAPAAHGGGWVVQLGAVKGEAEAKAEWARLKSLHKEQLSDLSSDIERVDLGAKGIFWRIRGGPIDEAQARTLCAQLTKIGQGCLVARK